MKSAASIPVFILICLSIVSGLDSKTHRSPEIKIGYADANSPHDRHIYLQVEVARTLLTIL